MASPLFCTPAAPHLLVNARASSGGVIPPAAALSSGRKVPIPSDATVIQSVAMPSDPRRPWWAPLLLSVSRRPGSDLTAVECAAAPGKKRSEDGEETAGAGSVKGERPSGRQRSALTAEKARVLRREMRATETWHDAMYHSAIASRLASPDEL